jgi:hypothetical protein
MSLTQMLRPLRARWQRLRAYRAASTGFLVGSGLALLLALARSLGADIAVGFLCALPFAVALFSALGRWVRPPAWPAVARAIDARYRLQDRVITAWDLAQRKRPTRLEELQVQDATEHLRQVDPAVVFPWQAPARLWTAAAVWLIALTIGGLPAALPDSTADSADQQRRDAVHRELAEELEQTLLRQLRELAELTDTPAPDLPSLKALPESVEQRLEQLKQTGRTPAETLATLSEIQAALAAASQQVTDAALLAQLDKLATALATVESLQGAADRLEQQDLDQASAQLQQLDPQSITPLERQTLAEQLKPLAEQMREAGASRWAAAVEPMQQALEEDDAAGLSAAASQLAALLKQQALRLAIQAELSAQLGHVSEAKGVARSGGNNIAPSNESRETWGQGKAGDPLSGRPSDLVTTRQRETLTGVQGAGPSDRQGVRVAADQGRAQRTVQPGFDRYEQAAEEVLRKESLPLGYRQAVRRYFRSIRP